MRFRIILLLGCLALFCGQASADDVNIFLSTSDGSTALSVKDATGAEVAKIDSKGRVQDVSGFLVPVGAVMAFAIQATPAGWLPCDGSAVSRTTYADLFAAIGTTYGAGDGATTFNLPDYRGRFLRSWDNGAQNDTDAVARFDRGDGTIGDMVGTKQYIGSGGGTSNYQIFNASGTWNRPDGVNHVRLLLLGGGAGGSGSVYFCMLGSCQWSLGSVGQGGSRWYGIVEVSENSYEVTIGQGGSGGAACINCAQLFSNLGGDGGATSFGSEVTIPGGRGYGLFNPVSSISNITGVQSMNGLAIEGTIDQSGQNGGEGAKSYGASGSPGEPGMAIVMWNEASGASSSGERQPNNISVLHCIKY